MAAVQVCGADVVLSFSRLEFLEAHFLNCQMIGDSLLAVPLHCCGAREKYWKKKMNIRVAAVDGALNG